MLATRGQLTMILSYITVAIQEAVKLCEYDVCRDLVNVALELDKLIATMPTCY